MKPNEKDYASHVVYSRALEEYCDALQQSAQRVIEAYDFGFRPFYQEAIEVLRKELG